MNVLMNKLERIRELSVEMKSDIDSINVDIESIERHLQDYCPISYQYQMDDGNKMIWDGRNILIAMSGHKGSRRLIDCPWKIKVTHYHKIEEMLDKIAEQLKTLTTSRR